MPGVICDLVGGLLIPCPGTPNAQTVAKGKVQLNEILQLLQGARSTARRRSTRSSRRTRTTCKQLSKIGQTTNEKGIVIPKAVSDATKAVSSK